MRFNYQPQTGEFTVYATQEEFQLASRADDKDDHKYRVIMKTLRTKDGSNDYDAIYSFINEYVNFVKKIFADLHPDEKIKDIVVFSTMARLGYVWTSLFDIESSQSSTNFMEMMLSYVIGTIEESVSGSDESYEGLMETMSERDFAKLTLAKVLLSSLEHPQVWTKKTKKKKDTNTDKAITNITALDKKLARYEKKFGFSSEQMLTYYKDDKYPDKEMQKWMELYEEKMLLKISIDKYVLAEKLTDEWATSFK